MKPAFIFKRYTWLVETIRKAREISFQSLNEKWKETEMSEGLPLSRATFNRQRDAVLDMFGLVIECKRPGGYLYYLYNESELNKNSVQNWMYSSISINGMLSERKRLFNRIQLESIPSAGLFLQQLLKAMYDNNKVSMNYHRYLFEQAKAYNACPYCLKLFNRRWYVVMKVEESQDITSDSQESTKPIQENLRVFSLDRIVSLQLLPEHFKMPKDFSAEEFFSECFGVVVGDGTPPTRIRLRAFGRERFAMRDLPIHHSQVLVAESPDSFDFEVYLRPTADFKAFLASKGQWLIALSPKSLADDVIRIHEEAIEKYRSLRL